MVKDGETQGETDAAQAPPETMIFQAVAAEDTGSAIAGAAEKLLSNRWWGCLDWLVGCWVGWVKLRWLRSRLGLMLLHHKFGLRASRDDIGVPRKWLVGSFKDFFPIFVIVSSTKQLILVLR